MRVPKRRGEKSSINQDPYLTKQAILDLETEREKLEKKIRPKIVEEMQHAASHGDFSENAAYQNAKGRLRGLNERIMVIDVLLKRAIPIEEGSANGIVKIGATVVVRVNGKERTYQLVGSQETDPSSGKISYQSPLGETLLNHKAGDTVMLDNGERKVEYKIVKVS